MRRACSLSFMCVCIYIPQISMIHVVSCCLRACLHGGGGPQVGEVTRLAVVEKWSAFTCKLTTPGPRGDVIKRCCVVARHVNRRENGGRTTHLGVSVLFLSLSALAATFQCYGFFTVTFDDLARLQM